jgi:hypothetical protein
MLAHDDRREPHVWRTPGVELAQDAELFRWIVGGADRGAARCRIFSEGRAQVVRRELLPRAEDGGFAGWLDRVETTGVPDAALVVNGVQGLDGEAWRRVLPFVREHIDRQTGGVSMEVFVGRYRRGPFGVHKDDQDVFTCVVTGKKRFLVWPFEVLAERFGVPASERERVCVLEGLNVQNLPDELRACAIVLEGEPGDLLYWPASCWHVAERSEAPGAEGYTLTYGLGIFPGIDPAPLVASTLGQTRTLGIAPPALALPLSGDVTTEARALWDTLVHWLGSEEVSAVAIARLLSWTSAQRFPLAPALSSKIDTRTLEIVHPVRDGTVAWARLGDELVWAAGGHTMRSAWHPGLERLFARFDTGEPLAVAEAEALLVAPGEPPVEPGVARHILSLLVARNVTLTGS